VAKFQVEVLEKAFVSVKKKTSLVFTVDQKFHFATSEPEVFESIQSSFKWRPHNTVLVFCVKAPVGEFCAQFHMTRQARFWRNT
jgi:superfamily II DNA/RNA helicase